MGRESSRRWHGRAFGLELEGSFPIPCVQSKTARDGRPSTSLELVSPQTVSDAWPREEAATLIDRRFRDGRPMMTVERHDELGYRVSAPRHGRYLLSSDGANLRLALGGVPAWRWQRLLFAQVLPLSAALQGLELFHASAVALDGRACAFIAPSGTGKTSIAAHLVARGATLVTDDALALEPSADHVRAHPGAAMASVDGAELETMTGEGRRRLGRVMGRSDKVHLAVSELADRPLPLGAVYLLERGGDERRLLVEESSPPDPRPLLSSRFVSYERRREQLVNHLEVAARVARSARLFKVAIPDSVAAVAVAQAIEDHVRSGGRGEENR